MSVLCSKNALARGRLDLFDEGRVTQRAISVTPRKVRHMSTKTQSRQKSATISKSRSSFKILTLAIVIVLTLSLTGWFIYDRFVSQGNVPDTDGDGFPDSVDAFPQDSRYHEKVAAIQASEESGDTQTILICGPCPLNSPAYLVEIVRLNTTLRVQVYSNNTVFWEIVCDDFSCGNKPNSWLFQADEHPLSKATVEDLSYPNGFIWRVRIYRVL